MFRIFWQMTWQFLSVKVKQISTTKAQLLSKLGYRNTELMQQIKSRMSAYIP